MTKALWMARLAGTQAEMGAQHGRLAADDAARLFEFYRTLPVRALAGDMRGTAGVVGRAVIRAIATTWQARLLRDRPADHAARSRAFIDEVLAARPDAGSFRDAEHALAVMDALQNTVSLAARAQLGPFARAVSARAAAAAAPACSSVIAWGDATSDGELLFARNFDFPGVGVWDAAPAFVACAPDRGQRYGFFTTRGADTPVVTVVNEAGLVLAPHTRWHRGVGFGGAMIVDLVHAIARRAESLADAIAIARERPISSSWGLAVGSARERSAIVLEIAGPSVEVVRPKAGASYHVCTNRYRSLALQDGEVAASHAWALHSNRREQRLRALVDGRTAPLDAAALARVLGDRHDACAPEAARQLGALLAQPTNVHAAVVMPAACRALVGVDQAPTCEGRWAELAWSWDGPAGAWQLGDALAGSGFTAAARDDIATPHDEATRHVHACARAYEQRHDVPAARAAIERAIACSPDDPSLRLAATWLALEADVPRDAVAHADAGLVRETDAYRRGQLLLWGARAARLARDAARAQAWTDELARLPGADVDELRTAASKRWRGRPHANLMMADAY